MDLATEARRRICELNEELRSQGDPAVARFLSFQPHHCFDGEWLVCTTWQLPDPEPLETWPSEVVLHYHRLAAARLDGVALSTCRFLTADEIAETGQPGAELPRPVA